MKKLGILTLIILFAGVMVVGFAPKAEALDLSLVTADGFIDDAYFTRIDPTGQGTGALDPFLRIQGKGLEKGYNTDGVIEFDTKTGKWTHSIEYSTIPLKTLENEKGGLTDYREIMLDAAETDDLLITVTKFYLFGTPNVTGYGSTWDSHLIYEVGGSIKLDDIAGSGTADMYMYIPDKYFTGDKYLYLYSEIDDASGSFEEWGVAVGGTTPPPPPPPTVPEPASMLLLGSGLLGFAGLRRKK